jgi:lambda repressor-like predicted transcriptional regulator
MTPNEIKGRVIARFGTMRACARRIGCGEAELSHTVHLRREYPQIRHDLANALGMKTEELFRPFQKEPVRRAA